MLSSPSFEEHFGLSNVIEGQRQIAGALKAYVRQDRPDLVERLEGEDDWAFLEPLLFTQVASSRAPAGRPAAATLEQVLFGYIPADRRPARITVISDASGRIHLPELGYLVTDRPRSELLLTWSAGPGECGLWERGARVPHRTEPLLRLSETGVELLPYGHPLFEGQYRDVEGAPREAELLAPTLRSVASLERAFALLREVCPGFYRQVMAVARTVVVFESPEVRPFVIPAAHGAVFLSSRPGDDEIFFFTELVHQFGHNILNAAVLYDPGKWLTESPTTPASRFTVAHDTRTLASAFHGVYTTTLVALCLEALLVSERHAGRQRHELIGRLADNRERVSTGFEKSDLSRCFTPRGAALFKAMKEMCHDVYHRRVDVVGPLVTTNQPFVFDYALFAATNPPPGTAA